MGILCERFRYRIQRLRRTTHDGQIHFIRCQLVDDGIAIIDGEADFKFRKILAEARQQLRHEILCGADDGKIDSAAAQAPKSIEGVFRILQRAQDLARTRQ